MTISPAHHKAALAVAAIVASLVKASGIDALVRGYVDDLTRNFLDVLDGDLSMPRAVTAHRVFLNELAEQAYDLGMTDGGADPAEKDDTDEAAISDWNSGQDGQVQGLWDAVKELRGDKKDLSTDDYAARQLAINDRISLWGDSLRLLYSQAKARAQQNVSVRWVLGDTEHCEDCLHYADLAPHRLAWWLDQDRLPQSRDLACHGFNCQCTLQDKNGNVMYP